jgi:2-polyprenyl-6-methoxyphenol hydroxylase-like FAD-dependent oxidoreductase
MTVRVAIAGAGLGGLCLAQGLRRAGIDVTVYERDDSLAGRRQGYRLHVDARAGLALQQCLPPGLLTLFQASCAQPSTRLTVVSERLRMLNELTSGDPAVDRYAPATLSTSVSRQTLREVLAAGLGGRIAFGSAVTGYDCDENGVRVRLAGGRSADADLLVAADGISSAVRSQYLPHADPVDTGGRCIYGKTLLFSQTLSRLPAEGPQTLSRLPAEGPQTLSRLPAEGPQTLSRLPAERPQTLSRLAALDGGFTAVIGGKLGMAVGVVRFRNEVAELGLSPAADYVMWGLTGSQRDLGVPDTSLSALSPAELHALSAKLIRTWHPDLRALHASAEVPETFLVRIRTSPPVPAWPPSRVTVLGDAIHAMSPAGGSGANIALKDAGLLSSVLAKAVADGGDLTTAIGDYEEQMRSYGYAAVAAAREAEAARGTMRNPLLSWLYRRAGKPRQVPSLTVPVRSPRDACRWRQRAGSGAPKAPGQRAVGATGTFELRWRQIIEAHLPSLTVLGNNALGDRLTATWR